MYARVSSGDGTTFYKLSDRGRRPNAPAYLSGPGPAERGKDPPPCHSGPEYCPGLTLGEEFTIFLRVDLFIYFHIFIFHKSLFSLKYKDGLCLSQGTASSVCCR